MKVAPAVCLNFEEGLDPLNFTEYVESKIYDNRIHDMGAHQHQYTSMDLEQKLVEYLSNKQRSENDFVEILMKETLHKNNIFLPQRIYSHLAPAILHIESLPIIYYAILKNLETAGELKDEHYELLESWDLKKLEKVKDNCLTYTNIDKELLDNVISGKRPICISAVYIILQAMEKLVDRAQEGLTKINKNSKK